MKSTILMVLSRLPSLQAFLLLLMPKVFMMSPSHWHVKHGVIDSDRGPGWCVEALNLRLACTLALVVKLLQDKGISLPTGLFIVSFCTRGGHCPFSHHVASK